jgi:hypothetical protein
VQFIEVSVTGMRSAVITLRAPDRPQRIVLFPMVHLGAPEFYAGVTDRLGQCAVVLAEGIRERSLITRALTIAYRLPGRRGRLGLIEQRIDYSRLSGEVINPDMTGRQLRLGWQSVPIAHRALLLLLAPVVGAAFWLLGTRRMLARHAATEDLPDTAEIILRDKARALTELLLDRREALLATALDDVLAAHRDEALDIAVVYGAGHMPGLTRYLVAAYGYRPREAQWLTVFDF